MTAQDFLFIPLIVFFSLGIIVRIFRRDTNYRAIAASKKALGILDQFYSKTFYYYSLLSEKEKKRFLLRTYVLSRRLRIKGCGGFEVTDPVRLFVAAAQTQLTFGFKRYFLPKFKTIFIYPEAFLNKLTGNMHHGEVNPRGLIVLSWRKFLNGYKDPHDRINLGLHEMAHALMLTIVRTDDHELGLDHYLLNVIRLSTTEMQKIKNKELHFFRKYAGTNMHEFFAVSIENFFEAPKELKLQLPSLYKHLVLLLKQDPANNIFVLQSKRA